MNQCTLGVRTLVSGWFDGILVHSIAKGSGVGTGSPGDHFELEAETRQFHRNVIGWIDWI